MNDVRLTAGQRRYAEARFYELGGNAPDPPKRAVDSSYSSPAFIEARAQLDELISIHEKQTGQFGMSNYNPYSAGYVSGAQTYDFYRQAAAKYGADNEEVKALRESIIDLGNTYSELAKSELLPKEKDYFGLKNERIVEARGYMKGMSDAAKARKGIKLK